MSPKSWTTDEMGVLDVPGLGGRPRGGGLGGPDGCSEESVTCVAACDTSSVRKDGRVAAGDTSSVCKDGDAALFLVGGQDSSSSSLGGVSSSINSSLEDVLS